MSKVKIVKTNVKKVLAELEGDRLGQAAMAGALLLEGAIKIDIANGAHTGRIYGKHRASAPGETPAVFTGNLINSIQSVLAASSQTEAKAICGTNADYAVHLEFGTSRMAKRPYMRPAYDNNLDRIKETVGKFLKKSIDGATS